MHLYHEVSLPIPHPFIKFTTITNNPSLYFNPSPCIMTVERVARPFILVNIKYNIPLKKHVGLWFNIFVIVEKASYYTYKYMALTLVAGIGLGFSSVGPFSPTKCFEQMYVFRVILLSLKSSLGLPQA